MIYILSSVLDNQKASKNSFQATTFKVEENSRTSPKIQGPFKTVRTLIWSVCELWLPTCLPRRQRKKQLWIVLRFFTRRGVIKW